MQILAKFCLIFEYMIIYNEETNDQNNYVKNNYYFLQVLTFFLFCKYILKIRYYKHQLISFIGIMTIGILRWIFIFFFINDKSIKELYIFLIELLLIIIYSIYYGYINGLMEYKFLSPYKCCLIFGIINTPIILIIDFIISYIPCKINYLCEKDNYYFKIIEIFDRLKLEIKEYFF